MHEVALLEAGFFAGTAGHYARDNDMLAQCVREHAEPCARSCGGAVAVFYQLVAHGEETFARYAKNRAAQIGEVQVVDADQLRLEIANGPPLIPMFSDDAVTQTHLSSTNSQTASKGPR